MFAQWCDSYPGFPGFIYRLFGSVFVSVSVFFQCSVCCLSIFFRASFELRSENGIKFLHCFGVLSEFVSDFFFVLSLFVQSFRAKWIHFFTLYLYC